MIHLYEDACPITNQGVPRSRDAGRVALGAAVLLGESLGKEVDELDPGSWVCPLRRLPIAGARGA